MKGGKGEGTHTKKESPPMPLHSLKKTIKGGSKGELLCAEWGKNLPESYTHSVWAKQACRRNKYCTRKEIKGDKEQPKKGEEGKDKLACKKKSLKFLALKVSGRKNTLWGGCQVQWSAGTRKSLGLNVPKAMNHGEALE